MEQIRDQFFWLGEINKASAVINTEENLLRKDVSQKVAQGIKQVLEAGDKPDGKRPGKVILFEPLLIEAAGMDATMLHIGRSSQDMHATYRSSIMRDNVIRVMKALCEAMKAILQLAEANKEVIVPNYTNGVAAQPNSYAHYLLGFLSAFQRDAGRLKEFYVRLNYCAMGTTVLNGTSWPLNRERMAEYLGFEGPVENAYDAAQMKSVDEAVEFSSVLTSIALHVATFIQDISVQYAQPRPWILLQEGGENTYVSSAMPQKRNPGLMINTRIAASKVIGESHTVTLYAHNIIPGMTDPKSPKNNTELAEDAISMLLNFVKVIRGLRVNPERAWEELNSDWTASQEMADVLMREYGLPFRVGHHVASSMVSFARAHGLKPSDFPYEELKRIYGEVISKEYPAASRLCPLSEEEFRAVLDPRKIVENRRTSGGPQKPELTKSLKNMKMKIESNEKWSQTKEEGIALALSRLDQDFEKLL